jgi:hydrocephalus-inducing protein
MCSRPIKAECLVPMVKCNPMNFLDFGKTFLRHPKTLEVELVNEDFLKAKYEIVPQDEQSKRIATYKADQESGIIQPKSTHVL